MNVDADRLSNPSQRPFVVSEAEDSGLGVMELAVPDEVWDLARKASLLPLGKDDGEWE